MKLASKIKSIEFESSFDCRTPEEEEWPTMVIEFLSGGAGHFIQIKKAHLLAMDAEDIVPFSEFLEWVCDQNDRISKDE